MAIKVDYVVRETSTNLFRNLSITLASILTVMVSLFLLGMALTVNLGVNKATQRWQGGIEFIVFINPGATTEQVGAVDKALRESPEVEKLTYVDQNQAMEEFRSLFANQPELIDTVTPDILPPSYRVVPLNKSSDTVEALSEQYRGKPGVKSVVSATETIKLVQKLSGTLTVFMYVVAGVLLGASILLVLNTIRMAMYARRREIEVMKLVGATNWFIRVPFMTEGLVQGVIGAGLAIGLLVLFRPFYERIVPDPTQFPLFSGMVPASSELFGIYVVLAFIGCVIGTIGAGVAVTRFLDV
ncbi:MAG: ABC transporter permease [Actinobacteria bacterium]|nr:ABC transporter permease [Actinomycetota bacterium]